MIHDRHFTREQANALLGRIDPMLRDLRAARDRLTDEEAHGLLAEAAPGNGGGAPGRTVGEAFLEVRDLLETIQANGVVIRDIDRGLVDFPSILDGREVYLCWQLDEPSVQYWHDLDTGFSGRIPLP